MTEAIEPPSGLGNFKGVMLCTRPEDQPQAADKGPAPFKSTVCKTYGEQVGLPPAKSDEDNTPQSAPPPRNEAVVRHTQWLKQLQAQMNAQRKQAEHYEGTVQEKERNVKEFCERQREQVRLLREEAEKKGVKPERKQLERALKGKPAWAKPKEEEEQEEEDLQPLLDFAENLNFDEYINDLEFREAMCAMRGRANKLGKEQLAFHEQLCEQFNALPADEGEEQPIEEAAIEGSALGDESVTQTATSRRSERSSEWDSTTCTSETHTVMSEERSIAEKVLEQNPQMKKVHSVASVQKIVEKQKKEKEAAEGKENAGPTPEEEAEIAKQKRIAQLVAAMQQERGPPAPVIQVTEEEQRCNKPVDPSMLPYLYRSPAV